MGKWICGFCVETPADKYLFASKQSLLIHQENFHKKRYDCPSCDKRFRNKYHAASHFKAAHHGERLPRELQTGVNARADGLREEASFAMDGEFDGSPPTASCPFCEERFNSPHLLRDHWRRDHPAETGHEDFAGRDSVQRENIVRDYLQNHPQRLILPLVKESSQENAKFKLSQNTFRMAFNEVGIEAVKLGYGSELVAVTFTYVVEEIRKQCKPKKRSFLGFHITADCLDTPLTVPFSQAKDFSVNQILEAIYALGTSDKYIEADDNLTIRLDMLNLQPPDHMSYGAIRPRMSCIRSLSRLEALARKKSVYGLANILQPFDCALVAFYLSQRQRELGPKYFLNSDFRNVKLANFEKSVSQLLKVKKIKQRTMMRTRILGLVNHFQPDFTFFRPQGKEFMIRLQRHMERCVKPPQQLVVFKDGEWDEPIFAGSLRPAKNRVYFLYLENEHICLIGEPSTFFGGRVWDCCLDIKKGAEHRCAEEGKFCIKCGGRGCFGSHKAPPDCVCSDCNTFFDRIGCYVAHGTGRPSRCETHATCLKCLSIRERVTFRSPDLKPHSCMEYKCRHCNGVFTASGLDPHFCQYQPPKEERLGGQDKKFYRIYFDMETCLRGEQNRLVPYLTTALFVCSNCVEDFADPRSWKPLYRCCGIRRRAYWFEEGMQAFLRDTFRGRRDLKRGIAVAYNMRNFDGYFLLRHLLAAGADPNSVTIAGNRLMSITFNGVQVKDMNLFLSGSLASLPASFGVAALVRKGNFPHLLANSLSFDQMKTYESPRHPPLDMYSVTTQKSKKAREELERWHATVADRPFNFKREAESYCFNDNVVLGICSEKLDQIIRDFTDGDISLLNSPVFTLASLTMTIFRHKFMSVPIGIIPNTGYTPGKHSVVANLYFMYLNQRRRQSNRLPINFALNNCGGEFRIDRLIEENFEKKVTIFRECEVMAMLNDKFSPWRSFYHQHRLLLEVEEPATVRGALAGGRTEVFAPYKKLSEDEIRRGFRIVHIDVHSLYPWAQSNNYFPSKPHPTPIDGSALAYGGYNWDVDDVRQYFGIFSVCLMYRETPYYPPIPYKTRGKGVYGCCGACMTGNIQRRCFHKKEVNRAFKTVLTSVDLELALENGAVLLKVYGILDYGRLNVTMDMFRTMMTPLVKGKLVAKRKAGRTRAQLLEMAKAWEPLGITLDPDEFGEFKPVLYLVYKLLMNSLWGKMAQVNHASSKQIVTSPHKAAKIIWDPLRRLVNASVIGAGKSILVETAMLKSEQAEEHGVHNPLVPRPFGQHYPTDERRALYCDTDSIVYVSDPTQRHTEPFIDPHGLLGSWVNEQKAGQFIRVPHLLPRCHHLLDNSVEVFVASAPKCYYYLVFLVSDPFGDSVEAKYRMKGVGLNAPTVASVSLETLHLMAVRQVEELREHYEEVLDQMAALTTEDYVAAARAKTRRTGFLHIPQTNLHKIGKELKILDKSSTSSKMLRFHFDKRVLQREYFCLDFIPSYPFGTREGDKTFRDGDSF